MAVMLVPAPPTPTALTAKASTYLEAHHFRGKERLRVLHRGFLAVIRDFAWQLEAWAVFSNHYHFIAHLPADAPDASNLGDMLSVLHAG
jgi:putative transposase